MPVVCWFARPNCAAFFIHAQRLTYATLTALTCLVSDQCREIDKGLSETQQLGNLSLAFLVLPVSGLSTEVFRYVAQKKIALLPQKHLLALHDSNGCLCLCM